MSKKNYEKPTMEFVEYEQEEQLLAGSVESTRFDNGDAYEKHLGIRDYPSPRVMQTSPPCCDDMENFLYICSTLLTEP